MSWILLISISLIPVTALGCHLYARWMTQRHIGQQIRDVGPQTHAVKAGTPTMGGVIVLLAWTVSVFVLSALVGWSQHSGFVLAAGLAFGALGLIDDLLSIQKRHSTGLTALQKILLGSVIAIGLFVAFKDQILVAQRIPFSTNTVALPWIAGFFLSWVLFAASTNSANLTDGLDGLAGGTSLLILGGFVLIDPSAGEMLLILPLMGCLCGFLWLNTYPASLFQGDVGSFALGGIIGALALAKGLAFLLPLLAGVFVLEAASVILQVGIKRLTGRRLFKMSPLHHHFETTPHRHVQHMIPAFDWPESKVTARFLLLQACFVALALWAAR